LAFRTYLIDTIRGLNGGVAGYQSLVDLSAGVIQQYSAVTSGGYNEIAIAYAGNMEDKLYIGGTLTIPIIRYNRQLVYTEKDATNNPNNQFGSFTYSENFSTRGGGIGGKLGFIYKPKDFWRIGFAFHTPQILSIRDELRTSMTTNTESYAGTITETSDALNSGNPGTRSYNMVTPYRLIASGSYVFREVNDTRKQRAFISADIEYVNYRGARFNPNEFAEQSTVDYLKMVNEGIKNYYRGNFNVRLGAELKLHTWMFRVGGGYFGSPYADAQLQANRVMASGGIGYRNKGIFIDLGYNHQFVKDVNFTYRLNDVPNTFAQLNNNIGTAVLTFGVKF
jgi:long-subunit fatty acid transport protein